MRRLVLITFLMCGALGILAGRAAAQTMTTIPMDHIHLSVPDPTAAANWYEKYFGARRSTEGPDRLVFGSMRFLFAKSATAKPSSGSSIDHLGFSVADLDAKMKEFAADGVKIVTPAHNVPGLYKVAFIEDPWGTRIEVVQDPELLGLHHIQIVGPNTEDIFTWLLAQFGGRRTKLKGTVDAVKYSVPSFTDIWILVERGDSEPSLGHSIDHISWRSTGSLTKWLDDLRAKGVTVTAEPHVVVLPTGTVSAAYVAGPAGVRIELLERPGIKPGE